MGKTNQVQQGEQTIAHVKCRYIGTGGIYDIQIRLGYRDGKNFLPEPGLDWTEGVRVGEPGIYEFNVICLLPWTTPLGNYDAECVIAVSEMPYPENREVRIYKDNVIRVVPREHYKVEPLWAKT